MWDPLSATATGPAQSGVAASSDGDSRAGALLAWCSVAATQQPSDAVALTRFSPFVVTHEGRRPRQLCGTARATARGNDHAAAYLPSGVVRCVVLRAVARVLCGCGDSIGAADCRHGADHARSI